MSRNERRRSSAGLFFAALVAAAGVANAAPSVALEERMGNGLLTADEGWTAPAAPTYSAPSFDAISDLEARDAIEKQAWKRRPSHQFRADAEKRGAPTDFAPELEKRWSGYLKKRSGGLFARAPAANCVPSNATAHDMNYLMYSGGSGYKLQLCPNTNYNINDTIYFYNFNQEISTLGYPTGSTRATLTVTGASQAVAIYMIWQGGSIKNIQINGNRGGLGWIGGGAALIETGGPYPGLSVQNCNLYEPRGWSALHIGEGACDNDNCQCSGFQVLNNQIGPCGDAPNSSWQFRRSMAEVKAFHDTPADVLRRDVAQAPGQWSDGISLACSNSVVSGNTIVDATDGMIVIFEAPGSTISGNTLVAKTRVALGGIGMVDYNPWGGKYHNTKVTGNTLRTEGAMIKIGIPMGGVTWSTYNNSMYRNAGSTVSNNVFQSTGSYFGYGIATSGMDGVTTSGNNFASAKFNGAPSYACIDRYMPPAPQAMVHDPFTTTGGKYQSGTNPADLMLLPCMMSCEFSDEGCSWPAWYRIEDLAPTSSAASSLASSTPLSSASSTVSSRASSSSSSKVTSSAVKAKTTVKTSSSKKTSSVKTTSKTTATPQKNVVKPTTTQGAKKTTTVKKATVQVKTKKPVAKPVPTKNGRNGKRGVGADDTDEQWVWPTTADAAQEGEVEQESSPFLNVGFGRNVYEREHLADGALLL